jgi:cysteine desulfurase family protein
MAAAAAALVEDTRNRMLKLMCCPPQKRVVFTASATEALNIVLRGLDWREGQTVYITPFEHNAVMRVLYYLQSIYNLNIIQLKVDRNILCYDLEAVEYQFQDVQPNVVIMSHASNVCGLIAPIKQISELAKKYQATTIVDMAQTAGLVKTNLGAMPVDYAVFAGHKTLYGPFGVAGFITDNDAPLRSLLYGGTGIDSANPDLPNTIPERFEVGSQNVQAIAGLNAALHWIEKISIQGIKEKEHAIYQQVIKCLQEFDNIQLILSKGDCIGVVSCVFAGYSSDNIGQILSSMDIAVRTGLHCAPEAHRFIGTFPSGTVRLSGGYFNTEADVAALREALDYIRENS